MITFKACDQKKPHARHLWVDSDVEEHWTPDQITAPPKIVEFDKYICLGVRKRRVW